MGLQSAQCEKSFVMLVGLARSDPLKIFRKKEKQSDELKPRQSHYSRKSLQSRQQLVKCWVDLFHSIVGRFMREQNTASTFCFEEGLHKTRAKHKWASLVQNRSFGRYMNCLNWDPSGTTEFVQKLNKEWQHHDNNSRTQTSRQFQSAPKLWQKQ